MIREREKLNREKYVEADAQDIEKNAHMPNLIKKIGAKQIQRSDVT